MRMRSLLVALMLIVMAGSIMTVQAATLRVAPISVDVPSGKTTTSVRVWNEERAPVSVQVRIFRWTTTNRKELLEPTRDVVVSPPMTTLLPGTENIIRIVRINGQPITHAEHYRLVVDQLPDRTQQRPGVNILIRHVIPVRFQ